MSQVSLREVCVLIERALNLKHAAHYFCILGNAAHRSVTHWSFDCGRDRWTSAQFKMHVLALFDIIPINKYVFWEIKRKKLIIFFLSQMIFRIDEISEHLLGKQRILLPIELFGHWTIFESHIATSKADRLETAHLLCRSNQYLFIEFYYWT